MSGQPGQIVPRTATAFSRARARVSVEAMDTTRRAKLLKLVDDSLQVCEDTIATGDTREKLDAARLVFAAWAHMPPDLGQDGSIPEEQRDRVRQLFLAPTGELAAVMLAAFLEPSDQLTALLTGARWVRLPPEEPTP